MFSTGFNATVVAILQQSAVVGAGTASPDMLYAERLQTAHSHHILLPDGKTSVSSLNNSNHSLGLI